MFSRLLASQSSRAYSELSANVVHPCLISAPRDRAPAGGGGGLGRLVVSSAVSWFLGAKIHSGRTARKLKAKHQKEQKALYSQYYNDVRLRCDGDKLRRVCPRRGALWGTSPICWLSLCSLVDWNAMSPLAFLGSSLPCCAASSAVALDHVTPFRCTS
jgi:hypothetical protein